jgi:hypothetical protein
VIASRDACFRRLSAFAPRRSPAFRTEPVRRRDADVVVMHQPVCTPSLGFAGKSHVRTTSRPADSQGTRNIDIPRYGIDFGSVTATRSEIRPSEHGRRRASTRRSPIHPRLFHGSGKEGSWIGTPLWLGHRVTGNDVSLQKGHKVFRPSCSGVPQWVRISAFRVRHMNCENSWSPLRPTENLVHQGKL